MNQEELAERQLAEIEQLKKDYISTFSTDQGKAVLKHLKNTCYVNKSTFPKDANGLTLAFHEGMRYVVGVHIKNMMTMDIESIKKLMSANKQEE